MCALALAVAVIGPWPGWDGAFQDTAYYRATLRALGEVPPAPGPARPLRAGFGAAAIPLPDGTSVGWPRKHLFASFPLMADGAEPLQVRAIALNDGAHTLYLVSADLLLITPALAQAAMAALGEGGAPPDRAWIHFGATHTHSGPGGLGAGLLDQVMLGRYRGDFVREVGRRMAEAVRQAERRLAPASFGHGWVPVPGPLGNRVAPGGPIDPALDVLALREAGGRPLATVLAYAAHPTTLGGEPRRLSGEYPAALGRRVQERTGAPAIFFAGAVGSMAVKLIDLRGPEGTERLGALLADAAVALLPHLTYRGEARLAARRFPVSLPGPQVRLRGRLALSPLLPSLFLPRAASLDVAALNDLVLVGLPGELSGEESAPLREAGARRGLHVMPTSLNGEYIGYIGPDAHYGYGMAPYETPWGTAYGPHLGGYFRTVLGEALRRIAPDPGGVAPTSSLSLNPSVSPSGR